MGSFLSSPLKIKQLFSGRQYIFARNDQLFELIEKSWALLFVFQDSQRVQKFILVADWISDCFCDFKLK